MKVIFDEKRGGKREVFGGVHQIKNTWNDEKGYTWTLYGENGKLIEEKEETQYRVVEIGMEGAEVELVKRLLSGLPMNEMEVLPDGKIVNGCVEADKREEKRKAMLANIQVLEKEKNEAEALGEEMRTKLSELLSYMTGGRYSNVAYSIEDMKRFVDDYRQCECEECDLSKAEEQNTRLRLVVTEQRKIIAAYRRVVETLGGEMIEEGN